MKVLALIGLILGCAMSGGVAGSALVLKWRKSHPAAPTAVVLSTSMVFGKRGTLSLGDGRRMYYRRITATSARVVPLRWYHVVLGGLISRYNRIRRRLRRLRWW